MAARADPPAPPSGCIQRILPIAFVRKDAELARILGPLLLNQRDSLHEQFLKLWNSLLGRTSLARQICKLAPMIEGKDVKLFPAWA